MYKLLLTLMAECHTTFRQNIDKSYEATIILSDITGTVSITVIDRELG
jgi:hypothetical protein